jgi:glycosyltransferase involved in cell wall biosynthesis
VQLVYLSPVGLNTFAQRPHHFVKWFHDHFDANVVWIDPGPSRLPRASDARRLLRLSSPNLGPAWQSEDWVQQVKAKVLPFEPYAWGRSINAQLRKPLLSQLQSCVTADTWFVVGKPCALALEIHHQFPHMPMLLDVMDNLQVFYQGASRQWMARAQQELLEAATCVSTSSTALFDMARANLQPQHRSKVVQVGNGCVPLSKYEQFVEAHQKPPIWGFVGAIDQWFDWSLIEALSQTLASQNPDAQIHLIGPLNHLPPTPLRSNVKLLPAISQDQVYARLASFSVGLIPFKSCEITDYVDPVKYYEYRAMGLPVLSSAFGEMLQRQQEEGVFFFENMPQDLQQIVQAHLSEKEAFSFSQSNAWQQRFETLSETFSGACQGL